MNCPRCGAPLPEGSQFCQTCGSTVVPSAPVQTQIPYENPADLVRENVLMGTVGALLGSLLGALSIFLFMSMEMVASLSGIIMAFCTLKGYELLGKKTSGKSIVISVVIMIGMTWLAYHTSSTVLFIKEVQDYMDFSFFEAFEFLLDLLSDEEMLSAYLKDLGMLYLFSAIGAVGIIVSKAKNR